MKRFLFLFLIAFAIALFSFSGCSNKENASSRVTAYYSGLTTMSLQAALTAEYTDYSVDFELSFDYDTGGKSRIKVIKPMEIEGITVRFSEDKTVLDYDGISLEVGLPEDTVLSPAAALPDLFRVWCGGVIFEQGSEKIDGTDCLLLTYKINHNETEILYRTWFDAGNLKPIRADIFKDGTQQIRCEFLLAENFK